MNKKVFAFDLDGTLTEHRTWITDENLAVLDGLKARGIRIVMAGAGQARRIFKQMREYPVDGIIGNYGLQYAVYRENLGDIEIVRDLTLPCDREAVEKRVTFLREKHGYTEFAGDNVEFHPSGCVTFPILGTKAEISDKLRFDPDRSKRRAFYQEVVDLFPEYTVFVGGSSSFDMAPNPYNKYHALDVFCREEGYDHAELTYFGDDYGQGGNDEAVYRSDFDFVKVDKYTDLPKIMEEYLKTLDCDMKYIEKIAVTDQDARKNAILEILDGLEIPYVIHDTVWNDKSVSNIVVSFNPSPARLVIGAHWDSVDGSTGANDNAASCSILVRLAQQLMNTDRSVDLVFFDREECGALGSQAYIDETGRENISAMVNLDVCGAGEHIVIWSKGCTGNPAFFGIMTDDNLKNHSVTDLPWLPYGDDRTFDAAGIPNITVCVLDSSDLEVFRAVSAKIASGQQMTDDDNRTFHNVNVLKTMHNGENDSIAAVSQKAVDAVFGFVADGL